jgi:predicted amidohydrolase
MEVQIACCQLSPEVADPAGNEALARSAIRDAVAGGARIVVLPELVNSGYVFDSADEARAAAVGVDGALLAGWAEEAARGDALVVGGFCELTDDGTVFNSAALVDGRGVVALYRKLHLWALEPRWFAPGQQPAPVVQTRYGRIGVAVCYDLEFPELTRSLALAGAELITLPTNWPREDHPAGPGGATILSVLASATAYLSKVSVAVCDRSGTERGVAFAGGSLIVGRDGGVLAGPPRQATETLHARCDLAASAAKRSGEHNDAFADRRPAYYAERLRQS